MKGDVLILGAGPSGMMAAHAVAQAGMTPVIIDRDPDKTRRNVGVFYLHSACDLLLPSVTLQQGVLGGDRLDDQGLLKAYAKRVYGDTRVVSSSVVTARKESEVKVYSAEVALDHLWQLYGKRVMKRTVEDLEDVRGMHNMYQPSLVVSTIPARVIFPENEYHYAKADVHVSTAPPEDAFVYYNVGPAVSWTRCSAVFGLFTVEYPEGATKPEIQQGEWRKITKVIGKSRPLPEIRWLVCTGRYGRWSKSMLTHSVYEHVAEEVAKRC